MIGVLMGLVGLSGLLVAEQQNNARTRLIFKALASVGFVVVALQSGVSGQFDWLVLAGLVCGLIGDVLLARRDPTAFLMGMAAFAVGHVLYILAFTGLGGKDTFPPSGAVVVIMASGVVLAWLWPYLGKMGLPVTGYMVIIGAMMVAALGTITVAGSSKSWLIPLGAFLFWISDLFVARNAFVGRAFINQALGLPLYYAGQFLIAFAMVSQ
jgi:uncharacterized membrane protein YhhN